MSHSKAYAFKAHSKLTINIAKSPVDKITSIPQALDINHVSYSSIFTKVMHLRYI